MSGSRPRPFPPCTIAAATAALAIAASLVTPGPSAADPFSDPRSIAECDRAVERSPRSPEAWLCYFEVARRHRRWAEAETRLRAQLAFDDGNAHARWVLGALLAYRPGDEAETVLREAAAGFAAKRDLAGEFRARGSLYRVLANLERRDEASAELDRMGVLAERSGDPDLISRWTIEAADRALASGAIAEARARLEGVDEGVSSEIVARAENVRGRIAWAAGRMPDARAHFARAADLLRDRGDRWSEADDRFNEALAAGRSIGSGGVTLDEAVRLAEELVVLATESGNAGAEAQARSLIAQVPSIALDRRIEQADLALAALRDVNKITQRCFALRLAGKLRLDRGRPEDRTEALALLDEAAALARSHGSLEDEARTWIVRANAAPSRTDPSYREAYARAIDVVEKMRDLRPDALARGRLLWDWHMAYHRLVGSWLRDGTGTAPTETEIDAALRVLERLRARWTLDTLDAAGATVRAYGGEDDEAVRRKEVLARIARLHGDLAREGISPEESAALSGELRRAEIEEAALRESIARANTAFARLRAVEPVGLPEIRNALRDDEALIAFQASTREVDDRTKLWSNGGSWAIVVTRDAAGAVPLPDEDVLGDRIGVLLGLVRRDDPLAREASARIHADVLAGAIALLPAKIRNLVLVPDGALHRVPFDALRPDPDGAPLGERFVVTLAPSATAWTLWRETPATPSSGILSYADPVPVGTPTVAERTGATALGRLPGARREAREIAHLLGGSGRVHVGPEATEAGLKSALPFDGAIVHLAAHAVSDDGDPARSAVVLAPGGPGDDGLLQLREIVTLPLAGKIVVLSACSGADGEIDAGEGVVGLASGFFQAGARAVVAGLWPVRDEDARATMVDLAGGLARGASLAEALAAARRAAIAAGRPASAWAGWVVLGDGDARVAVGAPRASDGAGRTRAGALVLLTLAVGAGLALRLRRRRRRVAESDRGVGDSSRPARLNP